MKMKKPFLIGRTVNGLVSKRDLIDVCSIAIQSSPVMFTSLRELDGTLHHEWRFHGLDWTELVAEYK
jgi:hypothetical protein